jgi:myxalamid-type polyketide synthase MxaE and MxaD
VSDAVTSAAKLALLARQLRADTPGIALLRSEPIAVVGIGCRIPGGEGPGGFWRMLEAGVDAITEIPADRWDVDAHFSPDPGAPGKMNTRWGSFLPAVDGFDAAFFGIAPREATTMDPQQRLLLEVVWEALEDAGQDVDRLAGSATGVFVAAYNSDYARLQFAHRDSIDAYTGSGTAHSIASGRISFFFDLQGPSVTVDTACSASLTAVHLACQSLRSGESNMALAGGASLILGPEPAISMSKWGMLAKDGRCKAFDARADGFVRGEGGVVVLKRLSDALAGRPGANRHPRHRRRPGRPADLTPPAASPSKP